MVRQNHIKCYGDLESMFLGRGNRGGAIRRWAQGIKAILSMKVTENWGETEILLRQVA